MKKIIVCALLILSIPIQAATIKTVAYLECDKLLEKLEYNNKPSHCMNSITRTTGKISLMLLDENIIKLKDESLKLSSLTYSGRDVRKNIYGIETYKLSSYPKVSSNNQFVVFDIDIDTPEFPSVQALLGDGEISYYTAKAKKSVSKTVDISKPYSFKVGNIIFSNMNKDDIDDKGALKSLIDKSIKNLILTDSDDRLNLHTFGESPEIANIKVTSDGKNLTQHGRSWFNGETTYNFSKPTISTIEINIEYWDGLQEKTAKIIF